MTHQAPSPPPPEALARYVIERPDGHNRPSPDNEWLLTTGNGGFAMGTASGVNRRKYHALLIASLRPPVDRLSCLASLDECLIFADAGGRETHRVYLSARRYVSGVLDPHGPDYLERFEKEPLTARWIYNVHGVELVKELTLAWRRNACAVRYSLRSPAGRNLRLLVEPRVTLRDFHAVNTNTDTSRLTVNVRGGTMTVATGGHNLELRCDHAVATAAPSWTRDVLLELERERHQEAVEHLFNPGTLDIQLPEADPAGWQRFEIVAALAPEKADALLVRDGERRRHRANIRRAFADGKPALEPLLPLIDAADDFLVQRTVDGVQLTTVLAGYPWFSDWGRDTMIALPGLLLSTGRFAEAFYTLKAFAHHAKDGLIPNVFDDYGGPPQYNTADASLWFLHACREYLNASGDRRGLEASLLPACHQIIERHEAGTHFGIRMDPDDGLIESGDPTTQLTWMDAKRDGVVFTPRHGKPVEVNALWHHGLRSIAELIEHSDPARAARYSALASRAAESFRLKFWHARESRLNDCLQRNAAGEWTPTPQVRPNQIFAASLEFSPLDQSQRRAVVDCVRRSLLTDRGLRTLAPNDPGYCPRFEGDMTSRDRAYHNGTVWPWLIGPYAEALLRADGFSARARAEARAALQPLLDFLREGCLGQIAEVYDAEPPRRPQGCLAQAWSVAEVLRVGALILG
ncbi:MAG: glycogen debranching enzyme family protein [Phycisphaerae bacterium]|nr:glycogen debranching enzyme family protein [Phycisphaerae bacterium]